MRVQETRVKKANNDDLKVSEVIDALENAVQVVFNDYMDFVSITKKTHSSNCIEFFVNLDARKAGGSSSKYTAEVNTGRRTFEISAADDDRDDFVGGKDEIEKVVDVGGVGDDVAVAGAAVNERHHTHADLWGGIHAARHPDPLEVSRRACVVFVCVGNEHPRVIAHAVTPRAEVLERVIMVGLASVQKYLHAVRKFETERVAAAASVENRELHIISIFVVQLPRPC